MGFTVNFQHILVDKRTGRLSFRRVFPSELRPHIPNTPVQLKKSLGATTLSDPKARKRYEAADHEWHEITRRAQKLASGTFDRLEPGDIAILASQFERDWHTHEEAELASRGEEYSDAVLRGWDERLSDFKRWRVDRDTEEMVGQWGSSASAILRAAGFNLGPHEADAIEALSAALNDKAILLSKPSKDRMRGEVVAIPAAPATAPSNRARAAQITEAKTFDEIAEALLGNERHDIGASTKQAARTALRSLRDAHGDLKPHEITKGLVSDWLDLLAKKPRTLPASERPLSLRTVVERYTGKPDVPKLSAKTIAVQLGALSALWNKAQSEEGRIADDLKNPFGGRASIAKAIKRPEEPQELSGDELRAIFALPIFTRGERPKRGKGHAAYWLPLMLLWTGARPEELAQLIVSDITKDAQTGRWMLRITDEGEHPHKGSRRLKTTEKQTGRRTFPIPQPLVDLNFIEYVDSVRDAGEVALFPLLRTKGERKLLFAGWGEWWNGYVQEAGILPAGAKRRASREFRHNWTTAARASGIARDAREYIQGHRPTDASANEGYGARSPLGLQIDKLAFDGLDLSGVRPWSADSR